MAGVAFSAVGNRPALHFIYYSTTKKTAFHLTKCVHVSFAERLDVQNAYLCCAITALRRRTRHDRAHFCDVTKTAMKYGFFATMVSRCEAISARKTCSAQALRILLTLIATNLRAPQNNFAQVSRCEGRARLNRSKTAESVPSDSRLRGHRRRHFRRRRGRRSARALTMIGARGHAPTVHERAARRSTMRRVHDLGSDAEFTFQKIVDRLRAGFAAG
jgi:hypothetical protein